MSFLKPKATPYDPLEWVKQPLASRARMVCEAWALDGYGSPLGAYTFYVVKTLLYVGAWVYFCSLSPSLGSPSEIARGGLAPLAFQKAILWSMLFEGLGLGCGSGPLGGRYLPPVGGFLYFLRPGTLKLPLFPRAPLIGGTRRTWFEVALYAALVSVIASVLVSPTVAHGSLIVIAVLLPALASSDRTMFLVFRGEHYWTTTLCFVLAPNFIAGAKAVQLALWFWAGFSKLNHHFPAVVCVMTSNSPVLRFEGIRRRMYRSFPDDLRPARLAEWMAHAGTALEMGVPLVLFLSHGGPSLVVGMVLMLMLHGFITSNVPMGVPIEWNVMVVYGAFALFWAHPDVSPLSMGMPFALVCAVMLVVLPLVGNIAPKLLSFLVSMRYYAGNWACGVWLFRGDSHRKLSKLKTAPWIYDQLERVYDHGTSVGLIGKVMGFRLMHLHGRALPGLIARAVDRLEDYEYLDGEVVAGLVLGWNFGDGHLHDEQLLAAVQERCAFEPGELRCIFIESQPLGRSTMEYRIADANAGVLERGTLSVPALRELQPWAGEAATPGTPHIETESPPAAAISN